MQPLLRNAFLAMEAWRPITFGDDLLGKPSARNEKLPVTLFCIDRLIATLMAHCHSLDLSAMVENWSSDTWLVSSTDATACTITSCQQRVALSRPTDRRILWLDDSSKVANLHLLDLLVLLATHWQPFNCSLVYLGDWTIVSYFFVPIISTVLKSRTHQMT